MVVSRSDRRVSVEGTTLISVKVQRDALDSIGTLFEQVGDDSSGRLSSMKPRLSSKARKSGPETPIDLVELRGLEPLTPTLPV